MALFAFSFVVIFVLTTSGGLLLFYREAMVQRISDVLTPSTKRGALADLIQQTGFRLGEKVGQLDRVLPRNDADTSLQQKLLTRAGYRKEAAVKMFYGAKLLCPLLLSIILTFAGVARFNSVFAYCTSLGIGFVLPDIWLRHKIAKRQKEIQLGLPEALDFIVICIEAGLSIDQATARTAEELQLARPELSDELGVVTLEQRAGRLRSDAWRQFAERSDVAAVRVLVSVLVQSEQQGTSIARTLRVHSDTLRTQRRQLIEEKAEKSKIKLVFPLVLLIFPSLFLVMLGPEAIILIKSFPDYFSY